MSYTIGRVARLAGVSVRTLHHYDDIGLLSPSERSAAGYRLYTHADLARLQQVLFFRELGFALEDIKRVMDDPDYDVRSALLMQRELLRERVGQARAALHAAEAALGALDQGVTMNPEKMFEHFDASRYEAEVERRWGDSDAFRESKKRTGRYRKEDWQRIQNESHELLTALAERLAAGDEPSDAEVMDLAESHRRHIDRWFYPCSHAMHRALGEMYVTDARFAEHFERYRTGLANFLREAIQANGER